MRETPPTRSLIDLLEQQHPMASTPLPLELSYMWCGEHIRRTYKPHRAFVGLMNWIGGNILPEPAADSLFIREVGGGVFEDLRIVEMETPGFLRSEF